MDKIDSILEKYDYNRQLLIAIMQDVQKEYHYLPEEILSYIAEKLKISEAKIYGVATFYENFSLKPKVKLLVDDIKKDFKAKILTSKEDTSYED